MRVPKGRELALACGSLLLTAGLLELGYRILDPFPYIPPREVEHRFTQLTQYDPLLGWRGVPGARGELVTENDRVTIEHNSAGFRDIEHVVASPPKDAIVFLGDSFTWGYEVRSGDMFVNLLRPRLAGFEVFNVSHRGWGTDQELLAFRQWAYPGRLRLVVLMFCENDIEDNNSDFRSAAFAPKFSIVDGELVLGNVPPPRVAGWDQPLPSPRPPTLAERLASLPLRSHLLHDVWFRIQQLREPAEAQPVLKNRQPMKLTRRILQQLRDEVAERGGRLVVVAIPAWREFATGVRYKPYQPKLARACRSLSIDYLDLAPALKRSFFRTYNRLGRAHWNRNGHRVAAAAIKDFLSREGLDSPAAARP
jgi:lysophospholipase L1-like esterase